MPQKKRQREGSKKKDRGPNPTQKLTTGLLDTYQAINKLYYARKKQQKQGALRRCCLWQLLRKTEFWKDMLRASEEGDDVVGMFSQFQQCVLTWLWSQKDKDYACFRVETAFQRMLKQLGVRTDLASIMHVVERFSLDVELMKLAENSFDDQHGHYIVEPGEMFSGRYCMQAFAGGGAFCKAWKAFDVVKGEKVCIKIIGNRKPHSEQSRREVKILHHLNDIAPDGGIVQLKDHFVHRGHQCLVFPRLAYDLYELLKNEKFMGVSLKLVRKFAVQILRTLQVLADAQLIHCDLKPENIMVVNYNQTKVNVIDFGSSCFGEEKGPMYIQSRFYRSPEVLLGVPYNCQADMWSFGCIMCEMFTGRPIFTGKDAEDQLMKITSLFGRPIETMMAKRRQFMQGTKEYNQLMKQPEPYAFAERFRKVGYTIISGRSAKRGTDEIKTDETGRVVDEDLLQFIDLVTKCLVLDPDTRLTPKEALLHPFCQKLIKSTQRVATIHESPSTCAQEDTMSTSSAVEASTTVKQAVES